MPRPLHAGERIKENCKCFCPSCGKDFVANVIYDDYRNHYPVGEAAIICSDCKDSPLARTCERILREFG